jgi:hypothetical protein
VDTRMRELFKEKVVGVFLSGGTVGADRTVRRRRRSLRTRARNPPRPARGRSGLHR